MIYVSTACLRGKRIKDILQQLLEVGIVNVELSGGTEHYKEIKQDLLFYHQKYGMNYVCHAYFPPPEEDFVVNLASCNDSVYQRSIKHYEDCLELLPEIGCKVLSVHAGFFVEVGADEIGKNIALNRVYNEDEAIERFCKAYSYISEIAAAKGIELYLENNVLSRQNYSNFNNRNLFMMTDFESIMKVKDRLDFNLLVDLGHLFVSCNTLGLNYEQECIKLRPYMKWIHVSQNNGIEDQHHLLQKDSDIWKNYRQLLPFSYDITIEGKGSAIDIKESMQFLV